MAIRKLTVGATQGLPNEDFDMPLRMGANVVHFTLRLPREKSAKMTQLHEL
jgi:hypothetical protein